MKHNAHFFIAIAVMVALPGCGTAPSSTATPQSGESQQASVVDSAVRIQALQNQVQELRQNIDDFLQVAFVSDDKITPEQCRKKCNDAYKIQVSICAIEFEFHKDPKKHRKCLKKAKDWYDKCLRNCGN